MKEILYQKNSHFVMLDDFKIERYVFEMINELVQNWGVSQSFALKTLKSLSFNLKKATRFLEDGAQFDMMDISKNTNSNKVIFFLFQMNLV